MLLAPRADSEQFSDDSKDYFKAVRNIMTGLTPLSLGLLVTNAKSDFQRHRDELKSQAANVIVMNRVLIVFGPEAKQARIALQKRF